MAKSDLILISKMTLLRTEENTEACNILNAALTKKYLISLGDSENGEIRFSTDSSLFFKRYNIDISESGVSIVAGNTETLYYALQRLVRMLGKDAPTLPETHLETEMFITSDPSIMYENGKYYLSSFVCTPGGGNRELGYEVYESTNLYEWEGPYRAFTASECKVPAFDGITNYWAPEICKYRGKYYIFATYRSKANNHRGCAVFRSDSPTGTYGLITNGHITPDTWDCIDNSLYVDENGDPWMVFVHEWTSLPDKKGTMCVSRMTDDLTSLTGEITTIFKATDAPWNHQNGVTDGPHIYRFESGKLAMIWSGYYKNGYCIGVAYSENGVRGPWVQEEKLLYGRGECDYRFGREGGHGFLFKDENGDLRMSFHGPNTQKGVYCFYIDTDGDKLSVKEEI